MKKKHLVYYKLIKKLVIINEVEYKNSDEKNLKKNLSSI